MPMLRKPSAWIPVAMSVVALAVVIGHVALFGAAREADEGTAAHVFQLLMVGQVPIIAFFAIKWMAKDSRQGLRVLALQVAAAVAALSPVYLLKL